MKRLITILTTTIILTCCTDPASKETKTEVDSISNPNETASNTYEPEKDSVKEEVKTELEIQRTFPDFVKKTNIPDSFLIGVDNVFYGDFNGDGKKDFASQIINLQNGYGGILIIENEDQPQLRIFGAGNELDGMKDLDWVEKIEILPEGKKVSPTLIDTISGDIIGPDKSKEFKLIGQGIALSENEVCGGGILFWNGYKYEWYHLE